MLGVKRRNTGRWLAALVVAATLTAACDDTTGPVPARKAGSVEVLATIDGRNGRIFVNVVALPQIASVRVSPLGGVLQVGQSRQYIVRVFDANENELFGRAVSWSTTTPETVFVGQDGVVRGVAPGYGDVIATVEGRVGVSAVTVPTPEPDQP